MATRAKKGLTNYFQREVEVLSAPRDAGVSQKMEGDRRLALLTWQTAYAGDQPVSHYEIQRDEFRRGDFGSPPHLDTVVGRVEHRPQTTLEPFTFNDPLKDKLAHRYRVIAVDATGRRADSADLLLPATG